MTEFDLEIINEKGLHARASAKFVEVVEAHTATAEVMKDQHLHRQVCERLQKLARLL